MNFKRCVFSGVMCFASGSIFGNKAWSWSWQHFSHAGAKLSPSGYRRVGIPQSWHGCSACITGLVQCVYYVKLCNGRVGGWGLLWQGSLDFIRCLSMVPTMAVSGFCSTSYFPNVSFSCCFVDASLVHLLRLQFWISCHDLWNFLSVDVLSDAV